MRLHGVRMALNLQATRDGKLHPTEKYANGPMPRCSRRVTRSTASGRRAGDPTRCRFDPKVLACAGQDGPTCLTRPQVETAQALYAP